MGSRKWIIGLRKRRWTEPGSGFGGSRDATMMSGPICWRSQGDSRDGSCLGVARQESVSPEPVAEAATVWQGSAILATFRRESRDFGNGDVFFSPEVQTAS